MKLRVDCVTAVVLAVAGLGTAPVATGQSLNRPEAWWTRVDAPEGDDR